MKRFLPNFNQANESYKLLIWTQSFQLFKTIRLIVFPVFPDQQQSF